MTPGPRATRRLAAAVAICALLVVSYFTWLRDSALVEVRTVTVTGLHGSDAGRIRAALGATARTMTTLHVDRAELERAASVFPVVRAIELHPELPHGLRIHVVEHRPAALLATGTRRVPVSGDGTVLAGLPTGVGLPVIRLSGTVAGARVPRGALESVRVAAGLPRALAGRVREVRREQGRGVVVPVEAGPKLIFGDGRSVAAKWAAAARVLGDPAAAGAAYVDVRIPARPAAGGLPVETVAPVAPAPDPASVAPAPGSGAVPGPAPPAAGDEPPTQGAGTGRPVPAAPVAGPAPGGGAAAPNPLP